MPKDSPYRWILAQAASRSAHQSATDTYPYTVANPYEGAFAQGTFGASDLPAPDTPPRPAGAITITMLLPMSSPDENVRALANTLLQAAQLALFDVARPELLLRVQDTGGTPVGAQTAARLALAAGADLIVGPLVATSVQAVAPVLANSSVPALAFSNDRSVASRNIWLLGFIPEDNIDRAIAQTIGQGLTRFGALLPEGAMANAWGARLRSALHAMAANWCRLEFIRLTPGMFEPVKRLAQYETRRTAHAEEMARLSGSHIARTTAHQARICSTAFATSRPNLCPITKPSSVSKRSRNSL